MKTASISETKNHLSALLAEVRSGQTVLITDHGRPVARLESVAGSGADAPEDRVARLERKGLLVRARKAKDALAGLRPVAARGGASIVQALLDERAGSR